MQPRAAQSRHQCTHVLHGAHQALRKGEQRGLMVGVRLRHIGGQQEALGSAIQLEDLGAGTSEGQGAGSERALDEGSQRFRVRNGAHALQRCGLRVRRLSDRKSHPPAPAKCAAACSHPVLRRHAVQHEVEAVQPGKEVLRRQGGQGAIAAKPAWEGG